MGSREGVREGAGLKKGVGDLEDVFNELKDGFE